MKAKIKEISKKVLFGPTMVQQLEIKTYYDLHGMIIPSEEITKIEKPIVQIVEHKYEHELFGKITDWEVYIDGKKYEDGEVTQFGGDVKRLVINACTGAG